MKKLYEVWMITPIGKSPVSFEGKTKFSKEKAEELLHHLKNVTFPASKDRFYMKEADDNEV